jgi:hypothetical protein
LNKRTTFYHSAEILTQDIESFRDQSQNLKTKIYQGSLMHLHLGLLALSLSFSFSLMAGVDGIVEPTTKWKKSTLKTCWLNDARDMRTHLPKHLFERTKENAHLSVFKGLTPAEKLDIQLMIDKEYTPERTGIHFAGWKDCSETTGPVDVYILTAAGPTKRGFFTNYGMADIGNGTNHETIRLPEDPDGPSQVFFVRAQEKDPKRSREMTKLFALHEFGHVVGLRHEHMKKEAYSDPLCALSEVTPGEDYFPHTAAYTSYDPFSIMNYCFAFTLKNKTGFSFRPSEELAKKLTDRNVFSITPDSGYAQVDVKVALSEKDVHTLKCLYLFKPQEIAQKCGKNTLPGR